MKHVKFADWLIVRESTPFTRWRRDAALGLKPPIPAAGVNGHSTAKAWEVEALAGKNKKKSKKKKSKKK